MTRFASVLALVLFAALVSAQEPPRHAAYVEIGGNGVLPTGNYEYRFTDRLAGRVGFGAVFITESTDEGEEEDSAVAIPVMVNFISHPRSNHHFEAGGGLLFAFGDEDEISPNDDEDDFQSVAPTALAGYRYQRPDRGFIFRAGFTPFYYDGGIQPFAGITFGYGW